MNPGQNPASTPSVTRRPMLSRFPSLEAGWNLPCAFTATGALCGLGAMLAGLEGHRPLALSLIGTALLTDQIDGWLARRLGQSTDFGGQLDSLADATAFVAAPALLTWIAAPGPLAGVAGALYLLAGFARLAAFHQLGTIEVRGRRCFVGLSTPLAAATFLLADSLGQAAGRIDALALLLLAPLMVSSVPVPKAGWHVRIMGAGLVAALVWNWVR